MHVVVIMVVNLIVAAKAPAGTRFDINQFGDNIHVIDVPDIAKFSPLLSD